MKFLTDGDRAKKNCTAFFLARKSVTRPSLLEGGGAGENLAPTVIVWMGEVV